MDVEVMVVLMVKVLNNAENSGHLKDAFRLCCT